LTEIRHPSPSLKSSRKVRHLSASVEHQHRQPEQADSDIFSCCCILQPHLEIATTGRHGEPNKPTKCKSPESSCLLLPEEAIPGTKSGFVNTRLRPWLERSDSRIAGFHVATLACTACAFVVFLLNLLLFIWATAHHGFTTTGHQVLYQGNCEKAAPINSGLHFLINILNTLLLGASGYCMQYLSAPTRSEVSRAHARSRWLDIGVLSIRNLLSIERERVLLWLVLAATSLPLHSF
jgi:hypothetical protein